MTNEEKSEKPINPMTKQIVVTTDSTGTKAWTVNPLGHKKPDYHVCQQLNQQPQYDMFWININGNHKHFDKKDDAYKWRDDQVFKWQQAESERKCYEKLEVHHCEDYYDGEFCSCIQCTQADELIPIKPNTTYLAEIVDENTVRILKEVV